MPDPATLYVQCLPTRPESFGTWFCEASPAEVLSHPAVVAEIAHLDEYIAALHAFALRCQRAHATPGCEREPLRDAAWCLDRLARKVEETADAREALTAERDRLQAVLAAARNLILAADCPAYVWPMGPCGPTSWRGWDDDFAIPALMRKLDEAVEAADRAAEGREG